MKKLMVAFSTLLILTAAHAQTSTTPATAPTSTKPIAQDIDKFIQVSDADHDMGKIPFGKPIEYEVSVKNVSSDSIKLQNVQAGCGCTTPVWKPGPYAPGETFKIKVGFNGSSKGGFTKNVTIFLDNGLSKQIHFHGETFDTPDNAAPANGAVQGMKPSSK